MAKSKGGFELYQDAAGLYRFRLLAGNGVTIAVGEGFKTRSEAEKAIQSVARDAPNAPVVDQTGDDQ